MSLPPGWKVLKVRDVGDAVLGRQRSPKDHSGTHMRPYLRVANVFDSRIDTTDVKQMNFTPQEFATFELRPGDILLNEGQSKELVGRSAIYRDEVPGACFQNTLIRFRPRPELATPEFAQLQFKHFQQSGAFQAISTWTTSIAHLGLGRFKDMDFPLPDLHEQHRLVARIEELTARSKNAREALQAIPPLLEKFRQSVLAAAFRGDLTAEWRRQNPDVEPASALLERNVRERREAWAAANRRGYGVDGAAYASPGLPDSWTRCSLVSLVNATRGITYGVIQTGLEKENGVPCVRAGDIKNFRVDLPRLKAICPALSAEYPRTLLRGGEILLSIRGTVGHTVVVNSDLIGANVSREVAVIPLLPGCDARFICYLLACPDVQKRLRSKVKGVAQSGINLEDVRQLCVPLAPLQEQRAVCDLVDLLLERVATLAGGCKHVDGRLSELTASVLNKAFSGQLT